MVNRGDRIRTCDLLTPSQARETKLRHAPCNSFEGAFVSGSCAGRKCLFLPGLKGVDFW